MRGGGQQARGDATVDDLSLGRQHAQCGRTPQPLYVSSAHMPAFPAQQRGDLGSGPSAKACTVSLKVEALIYEMGSRNLHHVEGSLPPVEHLLGNNPLSANLLHGLPAVRFPENPDIVIRRIRLSFHSYGPFVDPDEHPRRIPKAMLRQSHEENGISSFG